MKLKTFLKKYADAVTVPISNNFYDTSWQITKTDDEGNTHTKTYNAAITMSMVKRYFGNRRVRDDLVEMLFGNPTALLLELSNDKNDVLTMQKYCWAALFDIQEMYYNPLYNVDAHESVTHSYAQDKNTIVSGAQSNSVQHGQQQNTLVTGSQSNSVQHGQQQNTLVYGQDQQSTQYGQEQNTMQHGSAVDSVQYGAHETNETHKTSPFNDTNELYNTGKDITDSGAHTDTTTRGTYTDTETRNTKTDTLTRNTHTDTNTLATYTDTETVGGKTDTNTLAAYTDSETVGAKTDTNTRDARTDIDTIRRYGNIGVTKSSELLVDAADSIRGVYLEIMKDYIDYITEGY